MNPPYPPPSGYPPPAPKGLGCLGVGCIIVGGLCVILGGLGFYAYTTLRPFLSPRPVPVRIYPATQAQYTQVLDKWQGFGNSLATQHSATLQLSAEDLNTLISRAPGAKGMRGTTYVSLVNNEMVLECSFPLPSTKSPTTGKAAYYFSGKLYFALSFDAGDLNFDFHKIETVDGKPPTALMEALVEHPNFSRSFSRSLNDSLHQKTDRNSATTEFLAKVRSISIRNGQFVLTAADR